MTNITDILRTKNVLYAEDEVDVSKNTIEILELFFNKVVYVQNGLDAVDEFFCSHFDVLIFDICMPEMDGFQAIEQIRKYNHKVPIIILSAYSQKEYLWKAIEHHITIYLTKPYTKDSLFKALEKVSLELVDHNPKIQITTKHIYDYSSKVIDGPSGANRLSKNEARLLEYLLQKKNQIVTFEELYDHMWRDKIVSKEAIKSIIKELRKKIDKNFIKNIYGIGYTLEI